MQSKVQVILSTTPLTWSSGELFDGFVILSIGLPTSGGSSWPGLTRNGSLRRHPRNILAVIKNGLLEHTLSIYPTQYLSPPGCRYYAYWFDAAGKQVYPTPPSLPAALNITADYTLTTPTLTAPTISTTAPTLDDEMTIP